MISSSPLQLSFLSINDQDFEETGDTEIDVFQEHTLSH